MSVPLQEPHIEEGVVERYTSSVCRKHFRQQSAPKLIACGPSDTLVPELEQTNAVTLQVKSGCLDITPEPHTSFAQPRLEVENVIQRPD
jgi:hypothetical protein